jgi:hypothetical protein
MSKLLPGVSEDSAVASSAEVLSAVRLAKKLE